MLDKTASPQTDFALDYNGRPTIWTDWRVRQLEQLWIDGLTCSQIAEQMGHGLTRNAIIGKVERMGLNKLYPRPRNTSRRRERRPVSPEQIAAREARKALRAMRARPWIWPAVEPPAPEPIGMDPCSLAELTDERCHWPVGDPQSSEFHFCGRKSLVHRPYCGSHCRIAYIRPEAQRTNKRSVPFVQKGWDAR